MVKMSIPDIYARYALSIKRALILRNDKNNGINIFLRYALLGAAVGSFWWGFMGSVVIDTATGQRPTVGEIVMVVALGAAFGAAEGTIIGLVIATIGCITGAVKLEENNVGAMFGAVIGGFIGLIVGVVAGGVAGSIITGKTTIVFPSGDFAIDVAGILGAFIGLVVGAIFGWFSGRKDL